MGSDMKTTAIYLRVSSINNQKFDSQQDNLSCLKNLSLLFPSIPH